MKGDFLPFKETPDGNDFSGRHKGWKNRCNPGMNCAFEKKEYTPQREYSFFEFLMKIQSLNHSTYQHEYHIVWGTKYRRKYLKSYVLEVLFACFKEFEEKYPTIVIITVAWDEDHIHMQVIIPPNVSVSECVQKMKAMSSLRLRKKFKFIREIYFNKEWIWSVGYFSSTIGINEQIIRKYIEHQGKQDLPKMQQSFEFS